MIRFNFLIISDHSERPQQDNEHQHPDPQPDRGVHVNRTRPELLFHSRVWISLMLTFPVLLFSSIIQDLLAFSIPVFIGNKLIMPIFSIVIFLLLGYWLNMRRTRQLPRAISELTEHVPATTERIPSDGRQETVFY